MDDDGKEIGIKEQRMRNSSGDENASFSENSQMNEKWTEEKEVECNGIGKGTANICDLPRQIWLEIYENVDYPTYLTLRLVCSQFLHIIDEYIGFRVTFNKLAEEDPAIFKFYTEVALNDVQFEDALNEEKYNFYRIFKYPKYLTDISFTGGTNLKLVQEILLQCHNLQLVEMTMDCKFEVGEGNKWEILPGIDISSPQRPSQSHLNYVECLKLVPGIHNDNNLRSHLVLSILRGTSAGDLLRKVIFQCELSKEITLAHVMTITVELMEKHPKLEALFLALLNDEYLLSSEDRRNYSHFMDLSGTAAHLDPEKENIDLLDYFRNRITATGKHLQMKKMGLAMLNKSMQLIWGDFLKTQYNLVHLSLTVTIRTGTFSQDLFDGFAGTLEQLAIRGKFEVAFDFQHISNCTNLKEICLHNLQEHGGGGIVPKCVNLPLVPEGLESLILFQVVTRTEEVQEALEKLENLNTLVVFKCGHAAGETGIGLACLRQILFKRSLQSILMVQFICGSTTEAEAVAGILFDMAQDAENQANPMRRRPELQRGPAAAFLVEDDEGVLDLPLVGNGGDYIDFDVGRNGDRVRDEAEELGEEEEVSLPPQPPAPIERPVSRGNHRNPDVALSPLENEAAGPSSAVPSSPETKEPNENVTIEEETPPQNAQEFSLRPEEFPQLPEPSVAVPAVEENQEEQVEEINIVINADENQNNNALNVLQNILEHALVANADQIERPNPHLQNHMDFNQLQLQRDLDEDEDVELILNVDGQHLGPVLDLFAAERLAREHNVQVGFILDGVIDIMNEEVVRSKWLCVEDSNGHITYTLKISVEL